MERTDRQSAAYIVQRLAPAARQTEFFHLVSRILAAGGTDVEDRALHAQTAHQIVFRSNASLGFPTSDVVGLRLLDGDENVSGPHYELTVNFLGLHGSAAPVPAHMLETAAWSVGEESIQVTFSDFFSNRLIWLFYLIWRKYRYYLRYRPGATDQFSNWMFSFIGIGDAMARGRTDIPWPKLLTYLGALAGRVRSADVVAGVIAHAFDLKDVSIRQMERRKVDIPEDQMARLGQANMMLGHNFVAGSRILDVAGKFTVIIRDLTFLRFRDFLPSGRDYHRLRQLVFFLLKDQLAWDLELHMQHRQHPQFQLGREHFAHAGWTTFIGNTHAAQLHPVVFQARR